MRRASLPVRHSQEAEDGENHVASPDIDADEPPREGGRKPSKGKEDRVPPQQAGQGWTTVGRKQHQGKEEAVDRRGVTTFWSTQDGLYES